MCKFIQQNLSQVQQDLTYLGKPPKENDKKLQTLHELSKKSRTPLLLFQINFNHFMESKIQPSKICPFYHSN